MAADYSKTHCTGAPQSSSCQAKHYKLHLLRFSGFASSERFNFHRNELDTANRRKGIQKQQFLVSRLFIKHLYFANKKENWHQMQVEYRPSLNSTCLYSAEQILCKFGLSHSGNMISVFDAQGAGCGVDVQVHNKKNASLRRMIGSLPLTDQQRCKYAARRFYDLWVLKEAYAKLTGKTVLQAFALPTEHIWQRCYSMHLSLSEASLAVAIGTRPELPVRINNWYFNGHSFYKQNTWWQQW